MGAFIADKKIMDTLTLNPVLGHINTFGGHPICCAAGLAAFKVLIEEKLVNGVKEKEQLFISLLKHPLIKNINNRGLMIAVEFDSYETNKKVIDLLIEQGIFTDWFLFAAHALRIAPPINIADDDIKVACRKILAVLDSL
jgi:acetylornithine/succinyldiaminopimelate/putrescine aminotransferase